MPYSLPFPELDAPLQLLVVDDQDFDREIICARLEEVVPPDTVIYRAASGREAIQVVSQQAASLDCVILDMNLGDMHGATLTEQIIQRYPDLSVIMITAEADMDKALRCLKSGAEDFLIKGEYSNMGLYRAVRYAMERRRASIENYKLSEALARERELSHAQKEFIHLVSHEFRTPMAIISGAIQMLAKKSPDMVTGDGAAQFTKINGALSRLSLLLDDVIRLSKLEDGKDVFEQTEFDLMGLIHEVAESFDTDRVEIAPAMPTLAFMGDRRFVDYALHNLISNALKYSPKEAKVTVYLVRHADSVILTVIDRGAGMSPEMIARAGEKFYRDPKTSHIEGTGLGLHLTKRFMEYHGGALTFENGAECGTVARLVFPVTPA